LDKSYTHIYFLGIGGIGMSALARYFNQQKLVVCGYDKTPSPLTNTLEKEGIAITFTDEISEVPTDFIAQKKDVLVVYTPAIPQGNQLFNFFQDEGYDIKKRSAVLGMVTAQTTNLSVAGTHGKTTTSSLLATLFKYSDKQFSAFLGGISTNLGSNYFYQNGAGAHFSVTEADEFDRSFLQLKPDYAIITSTDADHLDIYGVKDDLEKSYFDFASLVPNNQNVFAALGKTKHISGISYSASNSNADFYAKIIRQDGKGTSFTILNNLGEEPLENLYLNIPGLHNLENAIGATLIARKAGLDMDAIRRGLAEFAGIKRRFEYIVEKENVVVIDDYAHHPSELNAIFSSVRDLYPNKKITAIFQPHLFTRTRDFLDDFALELTKVDELILLPIYPARELPIEGVTSEAILQRMTNTQARCVNKEDVLNELATSNIEVLLILGAGDIDRLVLPIKELYE
jgi:UDP-N-acetylmuramate--alanine ligase